MSVSVVTPSRIHVTLIDLNGTYRIDGGVGFALSNPRIKITLKKGEISVSGGGELAEKAKNVLIKLKNRFGYEAKVEIKESYKPHCGLGSGTQLSLAIAKAYAELYGIKASVRELAEITNRGGTSGIGVAAFEAGGLIVDGGHSKAVKKEFKPSSFSKAPPPPVIARHDFPWKVALLVPRYSGLSGKKEVNLFEKYCPIPIGEVRVLSHIILMKLLPSVVEKDLPTFREAISEIQRVGFKKVEVNLHKKLGIPELLDRFEGAGMSSTGTAIYVAVESNSEGKSILEEMKNFFESRNVECEAFISEPNNVGARVVK